MQNSPSLKNLIGLQYSECNCWKLAQLFYKQVLNIELKNYFEEMPKGLQERKNLVHTNVGDFVATTEPKFGDLILLTIVGYESHIAINIGGGRLLHSTEKIGSHIDKISRWEKMVSGFYTVNEGHNDKT